MSGRKRIAVNTRFLIHDKLEGIGLFTYESLKHIVHTHPDVEFYFLFDRPYDTAFVFASNVKPVVLFPPARHPFLWFWWFEVSVARWLNRNRPDLFLSTDGYAVLNTEVPQVTVMHDIAFEHFTNHVPFLTKAYYRCFMPRFAHKVNRIATVSTFSKTDIASRYNVSPEKIDVVYNGAKEVYVPISEQEKKSVRQELTAGKEYFVYVGAIHPRKNISRLLQAFDDFKSKSGTDYKLVLVGRKAWDFEDVDNTYQSMKHRGDVIFTGHVPPQKLSAYMAAAFAMVYVSLFEGFGIPIIESMSCDVPVITSNTTSMPEAAGDAALLVDPYQASSIAEAMYSLYTSPNLYNQLIEKGREQRSKFSWSKTAEKLWLCCDKAVGNS